ncbi:MAG: hypothetical protein QM808_17845 [Steroidobacteraceae bacterium]
MEAIISHLGPWTIFSIAVISAVGLIFHVKWSRQATTLGPTLLTTLGIFFCFAGIAWGLLDFDTSDIKASVPKLLVGIKTAFWASVAGIFWALTIKFRRIAVGEAQLHPNESAGATVSDLVDQLARLNKSISGNEDSTLLSQVKLLRSDSNERMHALQTSFNNFAEKMAEANSKALIQALSEVIKDFNNKLTEQFGENFKQLNDAVHKLVTWQIQYEAQLNVLIEQETATRKSMTEASLRYAELVNKSNVFSTTAESLHNLLNGLLLQRDQLDISLKALAELVTKAANGLPQIETKIVEMTKQIAEGVRGHQDVMGATLKSAAQAIQANGQQFTTVLTKNIESANNDLNAHVKQLSEDTKKQVVALDKALETELTKSIETLGQQLAALSQKFVQDYTPLTAQLQRVVQLAKVS